MSNLTLKQKEAIKRVKSKPELEWFFFKELKDIKWLPDIINNDFFKISNCPKIVIEENGRVYLPEWPVLRYLENIKDQISSDYNSQNFIIKLITDYTEALRLDDDLKNWRVLFQLSHLFNSLKISELNINLIQYLRDWLKVPYGGSILAEQLYHKLLIPALEGCNNQFALDLLKEFLFLNFDCNTRSKRKLVSFLFETYRSKDFFTDYLIKLLNERNLLHDFSEHLKRKFQEIFEYDKVLDDSSHFIHPAIEDHKQNEYLNDPINVLVFFYRNILLKATFSSWFKRHIKDLLRSDYFLLRRLGIYIAGQRFEELKLNSSVVVKKNFHYRVHHEFYNYAKSHFDSFTGNQQKKYLDHIENVSADGVDEKDKKRYLAYKKMRSLLALENSNSKRAKKMLEKCLEITKKDRIEHPDFHYYSSGVKRLGITSPLSESEIQQKEPEELVQFFNQFEDGDEWKDEPTKEGLAATLKESVILSPKLFQEKLNKFVNIPDLYFATILRGLKEVWSKDKSTIFLWERIFEISSQSSHKKVE